MKHIEPIGHSPIKPTVARAQIEGALMLGVMVTILPLIFVCIFGSLYLKISGNDFTGLDFLSYSCIAMLSAGAMRLVVTMGKDFQFASKALRKYHEEQQDSRRVPMSCVHAYTYVRKLPALLDTAHAAPETMATGNLMVERADELITIISELYQSSRDELWVLKQEATKELLTLGSHSRAIDEKIKDQKHAHILAPASGVKALAEAELPAFEEQLQLELNAVRQALS